MYGREYLDALDEQAIQRKAREIVEAIPEDLRGAVRAILVEDRERAKRTESALAAYHRALTNSPEIRAYLNSPRRGMSQSLVEAMLNAAPGQVVLVP